jgi:hypothetical protein
MRLRNIFNSIVFVAACALLIGCKTSNSAKRIDQLTPQLVSVKKIWDQGGHNAFTDLIRFNEQWFCTFRESEGHVAGDGKIRVLTSRNGDDWQSAALLTEDGVDLRDPKLSITPDQRLMLVMGGTFHEKSKLIKRQPRVAFSKDGYTWTKPQSVLATGDWLWRVTWHNHHAYGVVYTSAPAKAYGSTSSTEWTARFVESEDGIHYRTVTTFDIPGHPNEATARFLKNGDCVVLIRREAGDRNAWIGVSSAPYTNWKWQSAGMFIGGPNFIVLKDGSMLAGGRDLKPVPTGAKTFIGKMDLQSVTPQLVLPSGGDCSYPGMVWRDGLLWVSYYSSHEGKTSIYLAKIKFQ